MEHFGINQDNETGTIYFGGKTGGYISLADITYDGSINIEPEPVYMEILQFYLTCNMPVIQVRKVSISLSTTKRNLFLQLAETRFFRVFCVFSKSFSRLLRVLHYLV